MKKELRPHLASVLWSLADLQIAGEIHATDHRFPATFTAETRKRRGTAHLCGERSGDSVFFISHFSFLI